MQNFFTAYLPSSFFSCHFPLPEKKSETFELKISLPKTAFYFSTPFLPKLYFFFPIFCRPVLITPFLPK